MEKKLDNSTSEGHHEEEEAAIVKDLKEHEFNTAIAEVSELRQENTRLKVLLGQIEKDYNSLQTRFFNFCQPNYEKRVSPTCTNTIEEGESELVSLRLGLSQSQNEAKKDDQKRRNNDDGLKLGLDYNIEISRPISDPRPDKEVEVAIDSGPTSEVSQPRPNMKRASDDEVAQPNVKRARVSVRTKCDYPTINDGCQWRKYGQKVSRGNPCPRSYYRCSVAPLCPVRKQVQRCVEDMSILITTYEGTHNHSLPIEATAMASTTSAAASMILSGSSTSQSLSKHITNFSNTQPLYLSNSTPNPNPFPTITLDLTTFPTTSSFTSFNFPSNFQSSGTLFSNSLSFSSPGSNRLPQISGSRYVNYGPTTRPDHVQAQVDQQFLAKKNISSNKLIKEDSSSQLALTETLTKAITSDPSFQSVLAAAISSMVGATQT